MTKAQQAAHDKLKFACIVVADIIDGGQRDPSWSLTAELEAAALEYGRSFRKPKRKAQR